MSTRRPVLVVGAGFSGAVVAERLASHGLSVLVIDKRPHIGGNAYDTRDAHGILIHPYGPHIFHTNGVYIADYLSRFTAWRSYEHRVLAKVGEKLLPIPINIDTVNALYGLDLNTETIAAFLPLPLRRARPRHGSAIEWEDSGRDGLDRRDRAGDCFTASGRRSDGHHQRTHTAARG